MSYRIGEAEIEGITKNTQEAAELGFEPNPVPPHAGSLHVSSSRSHTIALRCGGRRCYV